MLAEQVTTSTPPVGHCENTFYWGALVLKCCGFMFWWVSTLWHHPRPKEDMAIPVTASAKTHDITQLDFWRCHGWCAKKCVFRLWNWKKSCRLPSPEMASTKTNKMSPCLMSYEARLIMFLKKLWQPCFRPRKLWGDPPNKLQEVAMLEGIPKRNTPK